MNPLLIRRRGMMKAASPSLTLLWQNTGNITTTEYNTGVYLFNPAFSFSIVLDASFNNYNWISSQRIIGLGTSSEIFSIGRISNGQPYADGQPSGSIGNYYTALICNEAAGGIKCTGLYSRNNGSLRRKIVVVFDADNMTATGYSNVDADTRNGRRWIQLTSLPNINSRLFCFINAATGTIHDLRIYSGIMSGGEARAYLDA